MMNLFEFVIAGSSAALWFVVVEQTICLPLDYRLHL